MSKNNSGRKNLGIILLFSAIILAGTYSSWLRFSKGLGATTHLSDALPWGLWIWLNLTRIALSSCGFIFCAGYFIFHWESLKPLVRPAVLISFTGYFLVGLALIYDLGLPQHFWHPLIMWNFHSAMFEVAWCLMLYGTVLAIELSIPITEGLGLNTISRALHKLCVPLSIAGVILSLLHQSSFGTLFVLTPEKLHPFWYSSWLPYLFLFSAVIAGISFLGLQILQAEARSEKILNRELTKIMANFLYVALWAYLVLLIADFSRNQKWNLILTNPIVSLWFCLEIFLSSLLPLILLSVPNKRQTRTTLCLASFFAILGIALNRLNVTVIGYLVVSKVLYFPSLQ